MRVISLNRSDRRQVVFNEKMIDTGIFKKPVSDNYIYLGKTGVKDDFVADLIHHGGVEKSCYIYGYNHYLYWSEKNPKIEMNFGIMGENITLEYLDENSFLLGDIYKLGDAVIQITQPRQPCYKLGLRFNNVEMPDLFRSSHFSGFYVKVMEEGAVHYQDELQLLFRDADSISVADVFKLMYSKSPDPLKIQAIQNNIYMPGNVKKYFNKIY